MSTIMREEMRLLDWVIIGPLNVDVGSFTRREEAIAYAKALGLTRYGTYRVESREEFSRLAERKT